MVKRKDGNGASADEAAPEEPQLDLPPGVDLAEAAGDDADFVVFAYKITYQNGFQRLAFDRVSIVEVLKRWSSVLGRKGPLLMFPADGEVIELPGEEGEDAKVLAPVLARADLILDIVEVPDDGEDDEDGGDEGDEGEDEGAPAPGAEVGALPPGI